MLVNYSTLKSDWLWEPLLPIKPPDSVSTQEQMKSTEQSLITHCNNVLYYYTSTLASSSLLHRINTIN